jgi:hypothetical protein
MLSLMVKLPFSRTIRKRFPILIYDGQIVDKIFGKDLKNKQAVIKTYNEINEETLNFIPKDRSLVFDVKTGWEPLCNFLNVPVPNTPFPRSNARNEFKGTVAEISAGKVVSGASH